MAENYVSSRHHLIERPWVYVKDVCDWFGVTYETAKNQIYAEVFPVPTYKVGNRSVIDREVLRLYFERKRDEGLASLGSTTQLKSGSTTNS